MIERKIIIGLITSTEYLRQIQPIWNDKFLESAIAKRLASWVWEYFDVYHKAPNRDIEGIFYSKLQSGLPKDIGEEIEEDILPLLSDEYSNESFNLEYLINQTKDYFTNRYLYIHSQTIEAYRAKGDLLNATKEAFEFKALTTQSETDLDLSDSSILEKIGKAFEDVAEPILDYPKELGEFLNPLLVRGGFIAFMAPEKRGKSYSLLDMAIRAARQKVKVAFFQAGDMSEVEFMMRVCIYLSGKSNKERYCKAHYEPMRDCIFNQTNSCDKSYRECNFGIFEDKAPLQIRKEITQEALIEAYKNNKSYKPCFNCPEYSRNHWGTPWLREIKEVEPLTAKEAKRAWKDFFVKHPKHFKLSTHPSDTLTVKQIESTLDLWEKKDNFVPDLVIVDYADILAPDSKLDFRHQQNKVWMGLRRISQKKNHPLVVTATQADAESYDQTHLKLKNFSEDKRKYAHVTGFIGMNQDPAGREKKLGLLRLSLLLAREEDYEIKNEITVLRNLRRGNPVIGSYW
jgi:replicative DNA helicase